MTDIHILTYNVNHNKTHVFLNVLDNIIFNNNVDILVLQECSSDEIISKLTSFEEIYYPKNGDQKWVRIFLKKDKGLGYTNPTVHLFNKMLCTKITLATKDAFTLIGAHFYSIFGRSEPEQCLKNIEIPRLIEEFEINCGLDKTIIVGDLNYKMHDIALHNHGFLNATNSKQVIRHFGKRDLGRGKKVKYFYNPMWNKLGDYDEVNHKEVVPGTFYWVADDAGKFYWNLIDGLLLRPEIMENVPVESIKIITEVTIQSTGQIINLTNSTPQTYEDSFVDKTYSDHLPIVFTLKI